MISYTLLFPFDIETTSNYKTYNDLLENDINGAKAFKLKYEKAQKNNNLKWAGTIEDAYFNNAPFLAEYAKIICISFGFYSNNEFKISTKSINDFSSEAQFMSFIKNLFNRVDEKKLFLAGHNIKEFDIPFLFKKLIQYGIKIPNCLNTFGKKPWEMIVYDTAEITKSTSYIISSLSDICYLLGLNSSKDDIDGSEVHTIYWNTNDIDRICEYCEKDTIAVKEILEKLYNCL